MARRRRRYKKNPIEGILPIIAIAGGAYLLYTMILKPKAAPAAPAPT